jgi:BirA family biotin operon repressor/biotin-[acetyl-CoA-carboxylase] ligase
MLNTPFFTVLDSVDSTNNYAMAQINAGLANNGMAYFAKLQTNGKGQRGKTWQSVKGQNILLSVTFKMDKLKLANAFEFNMLIALTARQFYQNYAGENVTIKWPNDIYWNDRKAGGILIENVFSGSTWKWAVVGIGINVNQNQFENELKNPISLKLITKKEQNTIDLAKQLHHELITAIDAYQKGELTNVANNYNNFLFKKDEKVKLKKRNILFETTIKNVDEKGVLHTEDVMEREFGFGEVEWIL